MTLPLVSPYNSREGRENRIRKGGNRMGGWVFEGNE
jgi:hypothetical protein